VALAHYSRVPYLALLTPDLLISNLRKNMRLERTPSGLLEMWLSDDESQFSYFADLIHDALNGKWVEKTSGQDQCYWDLEVEGEIFTVHREHYLGVSIFCEDTPNRTAILERLKRVLET
jgi:hypothetical protein